MPSPQQQQPQQAESQSAGEIHLLFPPKIQSTEKLNMYVGLSAFTKPNQLFGIFFGKAVKQRTLFETVARQVARMGYGRRSRWSR